MPKVFSIKHVNDLLNDPAYEWLVPDTWSWATSKASGIRYILLPSNVFSAKNCVYVRSEGKHRSFFKIKEWAEENLSHHVLLESINRPYFYFYYYRGDRIENVTDRRFMQLWFENEDDRLMFIMRFPEYALTEIPEKEPKYAELEGREIDETYHKVKTFSTK